MGSCDVATSAATVATVCPATPRDTAQLEWGGRCRDLGCAGAQWMQCPASPAMSLPHHQWPGSSWDQIPVLAAPTALGCHHAVAKPTGGQIQGLGLSWVGVPGTLELVQPLSTGCNCPPAPTGTRHSPCRSCLGFRESLLGSPLKGPHRHWDPAPADCPPVPPHPMTPLAQPDPSLVPPA